MKDRNEEQNTRGLLEDELNVLFSLQDEDTKKERLSLIVFLLNILSHLLHFLMLSKIWILLFFPLLMKE